MQSVDVSWLVRLRWAAAALFLLLALAAGSFFHLPMPLGAVAIPWVAQVLSNVALLRDIKMRAGFFCCTPAAAPTTPSACSTWSMWPWEQWCFPRC